jgi:hypothetical protein
MREADERRRLAGKGSRQATVKVRLPPAHATRTSQYTALYHYHRPTNTNNTSPPPAIFHAPAPSLQHPSLPLNLAYALAIHMRHNSTQPPAKQ